MILFQSTEHLSPPVPIDKAILQGLAPDGGLYVPTRFPAIDLGQLKQITDYAEFAHQVLTPFFIDTPLAPHLSTICHQAFNFPLVMHRLDDNTQVLECFHGPTLSFKDFGARFFAQCLNQMGETRTVLVATSGDTGSAVAAACHRLDKLTAMILFPNNKITARQQHQITCWGDNIHALSVEGHFDDCQSLVKGAFGQLRWNDANLTTANSINIARLLPQMVYYAFISSQEKMPANFIVPCGNLGNVTACFWAKQLGFPIDKILLSTNANQALSNYKATGLYKPQASIPTLANAMDVGAPSNLARLNDLFHSPRACIEQLNIASISDETIKQSIVDCHQKHHYLICPHTATAYAHPSRDQERLWTVIATAHPAKFNDIINPLLNTDISTPKALQDLLTKPTHFDSISKHPDSLFNAYQRLR